MAREEAPLRRVQKIGSEEGGRRSAVCIIEWLEVKEKFEELPRRVELWLTENKKTHECFATDKKLAQRLNKQGDNGES